ncbi:Eco57I restriction-modification methylase domain-containing protein [bacterium]|nr:Eco57I restriction-modification methylase domain-containing protein [bacterium]
MEFDWAIGNPPYQEETERTSDTPVYNRFMDSAYAVSARAALIHPARFLFGAGKTPRSWNEKMLADEHFTVLHYEAESGSVFPGADIKGGLVISCRDERRSFGPLNIFTPDPILNSIAAKAAGLSEGSLADWVFAPESYAFTPLMHEENPRIKGLLSRGHAFDLTTNIFDKLSGLVFFEERPEDGGSYVQIMGRKSGRRRGMWIRREYIAAHANLDLYKVLFPKSSGRGRFGEALPRPSAAPPGMGHTQTFISLGAFQTEYEARALVKYLLGKFARTMLGVLKVTQDNKKAVWRCVPRQNFRPDSDICWDLPTAEIDRQLYAKYGLSAEEIAFIEDRVRAME